jgi:hypothetical protein
MSLAVDQLELGPIGTNTYVVRASAEADEAVVVDQNVITARTASDVTPFCHAIIVAVSQRRAAA